MTKLLAVISPAKLLDAQTHYPEIAITEADYLDDAAFLVEKLRKKSPADLSKMMEISKALGEVSKQQYDDWHLPFSHNNAVPAILLFKGDVYRGMKAETFSKKELDFAQEHLRILSGLYGIVRPLDLVQAYRLMMGTPFSPDRKHKNLYSFWREKITQHLDASLSKDGVLVNLASDEYFSAIDVKTLGRKVVACEFKERKGEKLSIVSTYAKLARGKMAGFIVRERISKAADLRGFSEDNYLFSPEHSTAEKLVFVR